MEKVLIINDCKFESMILKDILMDLGYKIKITDEYLALNEIQNFSPNIVIANLVMKRVNGDKLIKKIKDVDEKVFCILSSSNELSIENYTQCRVDAVIKTPVTPSDLKNAMEGLKYNTENDSSNYEFCPYCGNKLKNTSFVYCPYCGSRIKSCEVTL